MHAAGHTILEDVDLHIDAGSQVAIIGPSGAGKSSLVGLLLGWHRAAAGRILIDGHPLDAMRLDRLRDETAWVDPAIQLWNRPLARNLLYGRPARIPRRWARCSRTPTYMTSSDACRTGSRRRWARGAGCSPAARGSGSGSGGPCSGRRRGW